MKAAEQNILMEQAARNGIEAGHCPECGTGLVPSQRIPFCKVPDGNPNAISFDCPNSPEHIEDSDLSVYILSKRSSQ
jgi:hypothetical protein